jgi:hypothetical protein
MIITGKRRMKITQHFQFHEDKQGCLELK